MHHMQERENGGRACAALHPIARSAASKPAFCPYLIALKNRLASRTGTDMPSRLQKPAYQLLYGIKKKELSTVFYDKTGIAPKYQAGLPISENTKTVGKNIDAPWIACIELVGL
jgi:hypothetical protein